MIINSKKIFSKTSKRGFTIIELLVVMAVMVILAAGLFGSQYAMREQVFIFQDQYQILSALNQAKNLTLGAFLRETDFCGYGLYFERPGKVVFYKDKRTDSEINNNITCISDQHEQGYNENIDELTSGESLNLNKTNELRFDGAYNKVSIMFVAPYLSTFITKGDDRSDSVSIKIVSQKSQTEGFVKINKFGQVTTR